LTDRLFVRDHQLEAATWPSDRAGARDLLLLHEGLGSVGTWRDFPARVAAASGWRVSAYSRLGYGASDPAPLPRSVAFMHEEAEGDLPAVVDALGLTRPVLFGHSDGGSIAIIAAARAPERFAALILEAAHVFVEDVCVATIEHLEQAYATGDLRARLLRHHGSNVDAAFRGWSDIWLEPAFRAWTLEALLPAVVCPVLVIQGRDDRHGTLAQVEAIARGVSGPVRTLVLDDCGHAPHREQAEQVLAATVALLEALPA
jgi:pimeloyl-ACP methyl ester carboxylesterase